MSSNETIKVSDCCGSEIVEDVDPSDHTRTITKCFKCGGACAVKEVCLLCYGTGEVSVMEPVYPGEGIMAPLGTRKCICQIN